MSSVAVSYGYAGSSVQPLVPRFQSSLVPEATPIVFILDEDSAAKESLEFLILGEGWRSETFASTREFLSLPPAAVPSCLVLDASFRSPSALELQTRLAIERPEMPIIFVANHINIPITVQAMKAGAIGFFTKPVRGCDLSNSIQEAIADSCSKLGRQAEIQALRDSYASLSRREREVLALVVCGLLNKQVGLELGISEITVKAHRGQVMRKMKAASLPDLVKMAAKLHVASAPNA